MIWSKNFGGSDDCGDLGCGEFFGDLIYKDFILYTFIKSVIPQSLPDFDIECGELGSGNTDAWLVKFDLNTEIENPISNNNQYVLYPNPAHSTLFVNSLNNINSSIEILITDLLGRNYFENQFSFEEKKLSIDIGYLIPGIYIVSITDSKNQYYNYKLIVQ